MGKLFTRILNNRLNNRAEEYNIYVEAQAGFRKNMGTTDNIFILNNLITHCLNNNQRLYCAFVNFTKTFDFIVRGTLWFKLIKLGVRGKMLDIIKSIYSLVKSRVNHSKTLKRLSIFIEKAFQLRKKLYFCKTLSLLKLYFF